MKVAITGKGGVGKTTLAAMLIGALGLKGRNVIAVDADPDANLASALGVPADERITPISRMRELIAERTGSAANYGGYFKLNPKVDDIPAQYAWRLGPVRLLVLGGVAKGGAGCICPASALLKALLVHLILGRDDELVMDMEAGIEHLGRATGQSMDAMIVVVDPGPWSVQTARRVKKLAGEIGIKKLCAVANRVTGSTDLDKLRDELGDVPLIGQLPYDERIVSGLFEKPGGDALRATDALRRHLPAVEALLTRLSKL